MTTSVEAATVATPAGSSLRGWIVTLAALGINLFAGSLYAWTVIGSVLSDPEKSYHWSKTDASIPFTAATVTFALIMMFAGRIQDKIGPRWVALVGGIVLSGGFLLASVKVDLYWMAAGFAVVGLGIGLAYSATTPAAVKWFPPARKGLITGIVVSGVGLSAVFVAPIATSMMGKGFSIPQVLQYLGIATIIAIGLFSLIISNPPAGYKPKAAVTPLNVKKPILSAKRDVNWPEMLATKQFYLLWMIFVLVASSGLMLISNISSIGKSLDEHLTPGKVWEFGYLFPMILAIGNTSGRFVGGFVSDRLGRTNSMILFFLLQAANMFLFQFYQSHALLVFGAVFTGVCYGTIFTLMPATIADYYGIKNLGVNFGILFTAFGVAGTVGPILGGYIRDHSTNGNYNTAFIILGFMLIAALLLVLVTKPPQISTEVKAENLK